MCGPIKEKGEFEEIYEDDGIITDIRARRI